MEGAASSSPVMGGDDARDVGPHAEALVPYVVALHEVVRPAGPGEGYGAEQRRHAELAEVPAEIGDATRGFRYHAGPGGGVGDEEQRHDQEDQDDANQHHLRLLDELVDHRREGEEETYADEQCHAEVG